MKKYKFEQREQFKLKADFVPAGDQPKAISELVDGIKRGVNPQTLLGVTGSGKTFSIACVIQEIQKPRKPSGIFCFIL